MAIIPTCPTSEKLSCVETNWNEPEYVFKMSLRFECDAVQKKWECLFTINIDELMIWSGDSRAVIYNAERFYLVGFKFYKLFCLV